MEKSSIVFCCCFYLLLLLYFLLKEYSFICLDNENNIQKDATFSTSFNSKFARHWDEKVRIPGAEGRHVDWFEKDRRQEYSFDE